MTTLIAVYDSSGCVGRCDAKCYNAQEEKCECICHGRNHGAGQKQAIENTRELAQAWIEKYTNEHELSGASWEVPAYDPIQLSLF